MVLATIEGVSVKRKREVGEGLEVGGREARELHERGEAGKSPDQAEQQCLGEKRAEDGGAAKAQRPQRALLWCNL